VPKALRRYPSCGATEGLAMIILAWFGGIVVAVVAAAAMYDRRTRRRGWSTGPTGITEKLLNVDGGGGNFTAPWHANLPVPFPPGGTADWVDDGRGEPRPSDQ
jgi:hypothetical protein